VRVKGEQQVPIGRNSLAKEMKIKIVWDQMKKKVQSVTVCVVTEFGGAGD